VVLVKPRSVQSCALGGLALALTPFGESGRLPVYRIPRNAFSTLVHAHCHGMAYTGREASHAVTRAGPRLPASAFAPRREIQAIVSVGNFNKRPICATFLVLRSCHPKSPVKHADLHDDFQMQKGCDNRGQGRLNRDKLLRHRPKSLALGRGRTFA
jgi:hypothetical protein